MEEDQLENDTEPELEQRGREAETSIRSGARRRLFIPTGDIIPTGHIEGDLSEENEPSKQDGSSDGEDAGLILDQADDEDSEAEMEQEYEIDASVL